MTEVLNCGPPVGKRFAKHGDTKHCIGVANGLEALIFIFEGYKIYVLLRPNI